MTKDNLFTALIKHLMGIQSDKEQEVSRAYEVLCVASNRALDAGCKEGELKHMSECEEAKQAVA